MTELIINVSTENDRGLQYGDGLFETIAVASGKPWLLEEHLKRLHESSITLGLYDADNFNIINEIEHIVKEKCKDLPRHVIKVMLTRGVGGRGYAPPSKTTLNCIVSVSEFPRYPTHLHKGGGTLIRCKTYASTNPSLAGMKHLCRLENVLARQEWQSADITDGLMATSDGQLIEGTMSNVFVLRQGQWKTPHLTMAGVNGVMRRRILDTGFASEDTMLIDEVQHADAVLICNSVMGIVPIKQLLSANKVYNFPISADGLALATRLNHQDLHAL